MAALITVTPDVGNVPPRQVILVTGSPGVTVTVTRTDPDGTIRPVRSADAAPLIGGQWTGFDYEAPFYAGGGLAPDAAGSLLSMVDNGDETFTLTSDAVTAGGDGTWTLGTAPPPTLTYTAAPSDYSAPFTATVAPLPVTQSWLIHPGVPDLSMPVTVLDADADETFNDPGTALHAVLGRSTPVVVSDGVRGSAQSALLIATTTEDESAALNAILAGMAPLLLQIIDLVEPAQTYDWIAVGPVTRTRYGGDPWRTWSLPYTVVDRPVGGVAAQRAWADLMAEAASWNDAMAGYPSWSSELVGP